MSMHLGVLDVLANFGFDRQSKAKLVRHQHRAYDVASLIRDGWFDLYQSLQRQPRFHECDQIVSFIGDGGNRARFVGVYRVIRSHPASKHKLPSNCPFPEWGQESFFRYELQREDAFADLEHRLVIEWENARAWHQYLRNRLVVEILPAGRTLPPFEDYLDFTLTHRQLRSLVATETAHRDWKSSLTAVAGIYLILAPSTGDQYIGSASGLEGIWGRWKQYAANGHGGNIMLQKVIESGSSYPTAFLYSVLQVLPKSTARSEVIRWENQYKAKLGSRAKGLNQEESRRNKV